LQVGNDGAIGFIQHNHIVTKFVQKSSLINYIRIILIFNIRSTSYNRIYSMNFVSYLFV
jgi:hypothetical protein